ncbi:hypothetical protein HanPI659440_Chr13g0515091 [Helianthus annuus]|nr:hypothetical protein HanPI659440_Chr13g0515091 [Helianthus annuus]
MDREDKPVYMEDGKVVSLYVVAFEREGGKIATVPKRADEELWYLQIVKNFVLLRDEDLAAQPSTGAGELSNLGIGSKKKKRAPAATVSPKNKDVAKAQSSRAKNVQGEKKGTRHSSDSWCDYVVVFDSLEGLAPVVVKKPKVEPRDATDVPVSTPDDPIALESSPERLLKTKTGKRKQAEVETEAQPSKKKPVEVETEKTVDPEATGLDAPHPKCLKVVARDPEKGKFISEDPVITITSTPVNVEENPAGDQGAPSHDEENDPLRPDETLGDHYYRTYSEKKASEIHTPVWNLKKGDTFSNWRVCRDWLQGTFPPTEIKFQEDHAQEQAYHAYFEEAARYTSTTHRIVREWRSMCKDWVAFEASKKKLSEDETRVAQLKATLEADRAKFESDLKTEEWSIAGWKRKPEAEAALLSKERKNWREIYAEIEKLKQEKAEAEVARDEARSHRERCEQREVRTYATLALRDKEIDELTALLSEQEQIKAGLEYAKKDLQLEQVKRAETSRLHNETKEKLESSETARVTAESQLEPLKNDMQRLKEHGIISIAESVLNSEELDKTVAHLLVAARNDGYAQGYSECSQHVVSSLKVDWDTSRSATHSVDTEAALATAKTQFNTLQLPVMDLVTVALQSEDFVTQLREVFPDREEDENEDLA